MCKYCYCEDQDGYLYCECHCEDWDEDEDVMDYYCEEGSCPHYVEAVLPLWED